MTMYLLLLISTAATAACAVWLYRAISRWRSSSVTVVSLSGGSQSYGASLQKGFIRNERRADGTVAWTLKGNEKRSRSAKAGPDKARRKRADDKAIRKPWGW